MSMDSCDNSGAVILTLPVELIRKIGSFLDLPKELLNFIRTCKKLHSAFGLTDIIEMDIKAQQILDRNDISNKGKVHTPLLLWVIQKNRDIDFIQHCINIYVKNYPKGLYGMWYNSRYPGHSYGLRRSFPEPYVAAMEVGRFDVIQAFFESGVWTSERHTERSARHWHSIFKARRQIMCNASRRHDLDGIIKAACESQNEDFVKFLALRGFLGMYHDLWLTAKAGFFEIVEALLFDPKFSDDIGQIVIEATLSLALSHTVADPEIIRSLFNAIVDPDFNGIDLFKGAIDRLDVWKKPGPTLEEKSTQMARKLKIYTTISSSPVDGYEIAKAAIKSDKSGKGVKILEIVFSGYPWIVGESESKRLKIAEELFIVATNFGRVKIARFFVDTFGFKYSRLSLKAAILSRNTEMIDEVVNSGISPNSVEGMELKRPLQYALEKCPDNLIPAFRLLYHGADHKDVSEFQKNRLWDTLLQFPGFAKYIWNKTDNDDRRVPLAYYMVDMSSNDLWKTPNRVTFDTLAGLDPESSPYDLGDNDAYLIQVNAMASLIFGDNYWMDLEWQIELILDGKDA